MNTAVTRSIEVRDPDGKLLQFPFTGERAVVGRAADAEVRLDHGMVSRHHCAFEHDTAHGARAGERFGQPQWHARERAGNHRALAGGGRARFPSGRSTSSCAGSGR